LKKDWSVSLRSSTFSLETKNYENFEDFLGRVQWVVEQAVRFIDSDFFTRVGLRYVNMLPVRGDPTGWLNEDLVKPLTDNVFGNPTKYLQNISGSTSDGQFNFGHGLEDGNDSERSYVLDFDFYREEVKAEDFKKLLCAFNALNFKLFSWCIGSKASNYLGKAIKKN